MTNKKPHVDMFAISIYSKTNVTFVKKKWLSYTTKNQTGGLSYFI
jgi:hypothetical protein